VLLAISSGAYSECQLERWQVHNEDVPCASIILDDVSKVKFLALRVVYIQDGRLGRSRRPGCDLQFCGFGDHQMMMLVRPERSNLRSRVISTIRAGDVPYATEDREERVGRIPWCVADCAEE